MSLRPDPEIWTKRLYPPQTISRFEDIWKKLTDEDVSEFQSIGKTIVIDISSGFAKIGAFTQIADVELE